MAFDEKWVEAYFNHGVDIVNRRVFLGDIDSESVGVATKAIYLMETESKENPCEIFISSYGGTLYDALALYDIFNTVSCTIRTFAYGKCMSAAPILLAAGEPGQRWVSPHAAFMFHDLSDELSGKATDLQAAVRHDMKLADTWMHLMAKHSTKTFKWWRERANRAADFYFSADEAIEWGLADHIWVEK